MEKIKVVHLVQDLNVGGLEKNYFYISQRNK